MIKSFDDTLTVSQHGRASWQWGYSSIGFMVEAGLGDILALPGFNAVPGLHQCFDRANSGLGLGRNSRTITDLVAQALHQRLGQVNGSAGGGGIAIRTH